MVGGVVIKITYKNSATHERPTIKTIDNETKEQMEAFYANVAA